jgi:hypothetical protein
MPAWSPIGGWPPVGAVEHKTLVDEVAVDELVEMGFPDRRLCRRLLFLFEGETRKCVKEMMRLEREAADGLLKAAAPAFCWDIELHTMINEFGFYDEEEVCKAALTKCNGDLKSSVREAMSVLRTRLH